MYHRASERNCKAALRSSLEAGNSAKVKAGTTALEQANGGSAPAGLLAAVR